MLSIDEAIANETEMARGLREHYECMMECSDIFRKKKKVFIEQCKHDAEYHEQLAERLEELKALRLLLDWAIECDFGLDSFPEEYAKYKHTLTDDMTYKDMMIQIAKCVVAEEIKE